MATINYLNCSETTTLVQAVRRARFPGIKFSVRSKIYSGSAPIDVDWTGRPTACASSDYLRQRGA